MYLRSSPKNVRCILILIFFYTNAVIPGPIKILFNMLFIMLHPLKLSTAILHWGQVSLRRELSQLAI